VIRKGIEACMVLAKILFMWFFLQCDDREDREGDENVGL
jgi:hypothetical protein